ncbi:MAG: PadR family transcriptional regulator [Acidimicrobiales bacterium]
MNDGTGRPAPPTAPADLSREWIRGVLEPCLLALVATGDSYGYELAARLSAAGLGPVPGGSLYPALTRLEKQGLVSSRWRAGDGGPGRKYYRLTAAGRRQLGADVERWSSFAAAVAGLLREAVEV